MLNKNKRSKIFTRRALTLGGAKLFLLLTLIGRLYYLQIIHSDRFKTFSDSNRIKLMLLPPLRGKILDRNGEALALNENYYRVLLDPDVTSNKEEVLTILQTLLQLNDKAMDAIRKRILAHRGSQPIMLKDHLSWKDVSRVEVRAPDLPGVSIDVAQVRLFPLKESTSHLLGYLGPPKEQEIKRNPLLNHPDFKIGRSGIEKTYEHLLRGKAGVKKMEVNAFGVAVRELDRENSIPGESLTLTIDQRLQQFTMDRLKGKSGGVLVVDIHNGDVLTLASTPGFDPHSFTYGVSHDYWSELLSDPDKPLINKITTHQYPPGSTFKLVVALAALKEGVDPLEKVYCPGYLNLGRHRFHCWKEQGHGHMNMVDALQHSCNVYFYTISRKIGVKAIADMAKRFGLGSPIGLLYNNEKPGLVPTRQWKEEKFNDPWQAGDTLNIGIGQGYMLTTPLQLAVMVARVASGKKVMPRITMDPEHNILSKNDASLKENEAKNINLPSPPSFESLGIPEEHLALVREGMRRVTNVPGGTAYGSRIIDKKYKQSFSMAGKTGTSQVISKKGLQNGNFTKEERKRRENHALFVGFAPVEDPRYAISVIVEHGGGGSKAAAPVARDVIHTLLTLNAEDALRAKKLGVPSLKEGE